METFFRLTLALLAGIGLIVVLALAMASLLPGCASQNKPATTQPANGPPTLPPGPTLLQILQAALIDAQTVISVAEASGLISGPLAVEVNAVEAAAVAALNLVIGNPDDQVLMNDAASKTRALVTHPAVVAAKAKTKLVPATIEP